MFVQLTLKYITERIFFFFERLEFIHRQAGRTHKGNKHPKTQIHKPHQQRHQNKTGKQNKQS